MNTSALNSLVRAALLILLACGGSTVHLVEVCDNGQDDNGDGKVDCLDPLCFADKLCAASIEACGNGIDDNGDGKVDCADSLCDGQSCGAGCTCVNGVAMSSGVDASVDAGARDAGVTDAGVSDAGLTDAGLTDAGQPDAGAPDAGNATCLNCNAGCQCTNGVKSEIQCTDNQDNDGDNKVDCEDSDCNGIVCGAGCVCAAGAKKETACSNGSDDDGDGKIDCADPDCLGAEAEICDDGLDNNCDRAVDCGDAKCSGNAKCTTLNDGLPCLSDGQCAGGKCQTEAATGAPNGSCTNATACTVGSNAGCHGGRCSSFEGVVQCRAACSGTGLGSGGCRAGYVCFDPDTTVSNNNNMCVALCSSDAECSGAGSGYGCNPWSRTCTNKDRGRTKYGGSCISNASCETDFCATGPSFPYGYCLGPCRGDTLACGNGGVCSYSASYGDNLGTCLEQCNSQCSFACYKVGNVNACVCGPSGYGCGYDSDCCSNSCGLFGCN